MKLESTTNVIIPAAGFGRRVGSPPAKEMLIRPGLQEPYIDLPIQIAIKYKFSPLVITRRDKHVLVDYIKSKYPQIEILLIEGSSDWPDTILQSESLWADKNLVLLPDTEFAPVDIVPELARDLDEVDIVAAHHQVQDKENWGFLWSNREGQVAGCEKPTSVEAPPQCAWGLFGFRKNFGRELLSWQQWSQTNRRSFAMTARFRSRPLSFFADLTR